MSALGGLVAAGALVLGGLGVLFLIARRAVVFLPDHQRSSAERQLQELLGELESLELQHALGEEQQENPATLAELAGKIRQKRAELAEAAEAVRGEQTM